MPALKHLCLLLILLTSAVAHGQEGKMYFLKDGDTLDAHQQGIRILIEKNDSTFIPFSNGAQLLYPTRLDAATINSLIVVYGQDSISFFNYRKLLQYSRLPKMLIRTQVPIYDSVFADRRNMYFSLDTYPFDNKYRTDVATRNAKTENIPIEQAAIVELYYQVRQMHYYKPGKQ